MSTPADGRSPLCHSSSHLAESSPPSSTSQPPVTSYHLSLARHLASLIRSASSFGLGQKLEVDVSSSEEGLGASSASKSGSSSKRDDPAPSVGSSSSIVTPASPAGPMVTVTAVVRAPTAESIQPGPPGPYTNLELLAQRDAEHRRAWFLVGHGKYVGGVENGFELKRSDEGVASSLLERRRKRKSMVERPTGGLGLDVAAFASPSASSPTEATDPPRKRARTLEEQPMSRRGTLLERRRISGGASDMSLSFAEPLNPLTRKAPVQEEDDRISGLAAAIKPSHLSRPTFINLPPAWSATNAQSKSDVEKIQALPTPQPATESSSPAKPWELLPPKLYRKPSFKLQPPPPARQRVVPPPNSHVTPLTTPIQDTPARVNAALQGHSSEGEPIGMSGSSVASLSGVSVVCPSMAGHKNENMASSSKGGLRPAGLFEGLSIGFSPAITPDGNGLLGILGVGIGGGEGIADDVPPGAVAMEDNGSKTGLVNNGAQMPMDESMMIGRRIEDEWWANYVDFGDGEPVSEMGGLRGGLA